MPTVSSASVDVVTSDEDGWVWRPRRSPFDGRNSSTLDEETEILWLQETERVQWFRAEAEFLRWLEQLERKHFEFLRLLRSYEWSKNLWSRRASNCPPRSGFRAFASRLSDGYSQLLVDARDLFSRHVHPSLVPDATDIETLSHAVLVNRCLEFRTVLLNSAYKAKG